MNIPITIEEAKENGTFAHWLKLAEVMLKYNEQHEGKSLVLCVLSTAIELHDFDEQQPFYTFQFKVNADKRNSKRKKVLPHRCRGAK